MENVELIDADLSGGAIEITWQLPAQSWLFST